MSSSRSRWLVAALLIHAAGACRADPEIEGLDLISSARFDRTRFDYTYALRIRGDSTGYTDASFSVGTSAAGTTVLKPNVAVGRIDAGEFVRTTDRLIIRQDRQIPLDRSQFRFTFNGRTATTSAPTNGGPIVDEVTLLRPEGRPGHGVATSLGGSTPTAGATLALRASVSGLISSVQYRLLNQVGGALATGSLMSPSSGVAWYYELITVPSVPFTIEVVATATSGPKTTWQSRTFTPSPVDVRIVRDSALLKVGATKSMAIELNSITAGGDYLVTLLVPTGFTSSASAWTVPLAAGAKASIPLSVSAPASAERFSRSTFGVSYAPKNDPGAARITNFSFSLE